MIEDPLLWFVAPAPCDAFLACSWLGEQVLIRDSGMCGGRPSILGGLLLDGLNFVFDCFNF